MNARVVLAIDFHVLRMHFFFFLSLKLAFSSTYHVFLLVFLCCEETGTTGIMMYSVLSICPISFARSLGCLCYHGRLPLRLDTVTYPLASVQLLWGGGGEL